MADATAFERRMPHDGDPSAVVGLAEVRFAQAWTVRGDPTRAEFIAAIERSSGMPLPIQPNATSTTTDSAMLWVGPRSWLWLAETPKLEFASTRKALNAAGGALFDVSASYVMWRVAGQDAARVLNRMCPLDLHDSAFPSGRCGQTLLGHVNAILYRPRAASAFLVMVARSYAGDAWHHLHASAATDGYSTQTAITFSQAHA